MMRVNHCAGVLLAACAILGNGVVAAANEAPAAAGAYAPSFVPTKANRLVVLDVAKAGANLVAVGERGVILTSADGCTTWKAQRAPTTRTLTGVAFSDDKNGVAVGHGATILRTSDGGATWQAVTVADAGQDSLLGVVALGGTRLLAYGSFGAFLESKDNGATWTRSQIIDDEFDRHISQVFKAGNKFVLVGESAALATSDDGIEWKRLESPYKGSWFGGLQTKGGALLIYGMRGNVYRSEDGGAHCKKIDLGPDPRSLTNGKVMEDGSIVLIGIAGRVVVSNDDGRSFAPVKAAVRQGLAQLMPLADGKLLVVGDAGVAKIDAPAAAAK